MTAPQRVQPRRETRTTQPLRSVPPIQPTPRAGLLASLAVVLVFSVLLGATMLHSSLITGQRQLDQLDHDANVAQIQHDRLRLKVAQMQSPYRIVQAAQAQGMVQPDQTIWLHPVPPTPATTPAPTSSTTPASSAPSGADRAGAPSNRPSNSAPGQ